MSIKSGFSAEDRAAHYLEGQGYKIIGRNIRYPFGELDIVALERTVLVFVEVKHRTNALYGEPYEAVSPAKKRKIIKAAQAFLQKNRGPWPTCRFDVISMVGELSHLRIEHISDAFCEND